MQLMSFLGLGAFAFITLANGSSAILYFQYATIFIPLKEASLSPYFLFQKVYALR